jgi:hypothetical protein
MRCVTSGVRYDDMSTTWPPDTFCPLTMTTGGVPVADAWVSCWRTAARLPLPGVTCWPLMVMTCGSPAP